MTKSHDRGYAGEQNMGFFFGPLGYVFIEGPSGKSGHKASAPGFDGVAYNPKTGFLIIYDNKAYERQEKVYDPDKAGAITKNLGKNLAKQIKKFQIWILSIFLANAPLLVNLNQHNFL